MIADAVAAEQQEAEAFAAAQRQLVVRVAEQVRQQEAVPAAAAMEQAAAAARLQTQLKVAAAVVFKNKVKKAADVGAQQRVWKSTAFMLGNAAKGASGAVTHAAPQDTASVLFTSTTRQMISSRQPMVITRKLLTVLTSDVYEHFHYIACHT